MRTNAPNDAALLAGTLAVLTWRVAAFASPSSFVVVPEGLRLPLTGLGLVFLACGVAARRARQDRYTAVFLWYGLGGGIHWGGAVGSAGEPLEWALFFAYLGPTALSDAALLHLSLIFPTGQRLGVKTCVALYSPAVAALVGAALVGVWPDAVRQGLAAFLLLVANLYSLAAGFIFVFRAFTADAATRRAARLPLIATSMVAASLVALFGAAGVLPGPSDAWNLALGLIPISLAAALVSHESAV